MPRPIIRVIDTETTGLGPPPENRILQIGAADLHPDGKVRRNVARYVHPGDIDPAATWRPKLTARAIKRGKSPEEVAPFFAGAPIYAMHNAAFDWPLLEPLLGPAQIICTLKCSQVLAPKLTSHKCSDLYIGLTGLDPGKIHKAGKDARMTAVILKYLLAANTLEELLTISAQDVIGYGKKHKGEFYSSVSKTDPAYLVWIVNDSCLDQQTKATAAKYL